MFLSKKKKKKRTVINYKKENELHNSHTSPVTYRYLYATKDEHTVLMKDIEGMNNCRKSIKTRHMEEENQVETANVRNKIKRLTIIIFLYNKEKRQK